MGSPLYRGSLLWDKLPQHVQCCETILSFNKHLCSMNRDYVDLLVKI